MELNKIYNEDCLEGIKRIPNKSIDLILTDPPYNIGKAEWDKIDKYVDWMGNIFLECQRVLKDNGSFYFWHNDMNQIVKLLNWIDKHTDFIFNSFIIWDKVDFRANAWKNPSENNKLRSFFNTCEYCLFFTFQETGEISASSGSSRHFKPIIDYMIEQKKLTMQNKGFKTTKEFNEYINDLTGTSSSVSRHYFANSQWRPPTKELYAKLQGTGYFKKPFEDIQGKLDELRYLHKVGPNHNNVWRSKKYNSGKFHVCEKPQDLLTRIIKTSSEVDDIVLDLFMGSGSTAVACAKEKRNFIGFELDEKYFNIANERIEQIK